MIIVSFSVN